MPALILDNVSKVYAPRRRSWKDRLTSTPQQQGIRALDSVSLSVEHGEFFGLLGPNGAGKTTLISRLAGLASATSGSASVCGHDVMTDFRQSRCSLGVVPQEIVYDPFFTVRETLRTPSGYIILSINVDWTHEILSNLGLL